MGNTKSYPNAQEEVDTTIFMVDFVCWSITAFSKTILLTLWVLHAFFNMNIIRTKSKERSDIRPKSNSVSGLSSGAPDESDKVSHTASDLTVGKSSADHQVEMQNAMIEATDKPAATMDPKARLYITLSIVAAAIYSYFYIALHTVRYVGIMKEFSCVLPAISLGVGWASNRLFLYLYLMHRLKASFEGTFLAMKQSEYNILMRMYCILITVGVLWYIGYATYVGCDGLGILISFIPLNVLDSFCAIVCLYIFIKKLKAVINMDKTLFERDPKGMNDLKGLVNKLLIISLFAISFTYIVSLVFFIYPMKSLAGIDTMVNVFCLMISTANYDLYYKMSCVLCRNCCEKSFNFKKKQEATTSEIISP